MATKKPAKKTTKKRATKAKKPAARKPAKRVAKKPAAKKPAKRAAAKKPAAKAKAPKKVKEPTPIGRVTHYFDHLKVAVIQLESGNSLKIGDSIRIQGGEVDFTQPIQSLQVEHADVSSVKAGDDFGTKVKQLVREGYRVYKA